MHSSQPSLTVFVRQSDAAPRAAYDWRVLAPGALWPDLAALSACPSEWVCVVEDAYHGPFESLSGFAGAVSAHVAHIAPAYGPRLADAPLQALLLGRAFETSAVAWRRLDLIEVGGFDASLGREADRAAALKLGAAGRAFQVGQAPALPAARVDVALTQAVIAAAGPCIWAQSGPIGPTAATLSLAVDAGARAVGAGQEGVFAAQGLPALNPAEIGEFGLDAVVLDALARGAEGRLGDALSDPGFTRRFHDLFDAFVRAGAPARLIDRARLMAAWKLGVAPEAGGPVSVTGLSIDLNADLPDLHCAAATAFLIELRVDGEPIGVMDAVHPGGAAPHWLGERLAERLAQEPAWRLARIRSLRKRPEFWGALARRAAGLAQDRLARRSSSETLAQSLASLSHHAHVDAVRAVLSSTGFAHAEDITARGPARAVTALMYHAITPTGAPDRAYSVRAERFREQIGWLSANGYRWLSAQEWARAVRARQSVSSRRILITFDDAYVDFAEFAWPILKEFGFSATMFTPSSWVGRSPAWYDSDGGLRVMTFAEMRALAAEGCEFGSHSATHRHLTALSAADLMEEMAGSRKALEDGLGASIETIAYPFGDSDAMVRSAARSAGFVGGYANWGGTSAITDDPMNLKRIEVATDDDLGAFIAKIRSE